MSCWRRERAGSVAVWVACVLVAAASGARGQAGPSADELDKLLALDDAIDGAIVYSKMPLPRKIFKIVIGDPDNSQAWTETELCDGDYARWRPDGNQLVVGDGGHMFLVDPDTGDRTRVSSVSYTVSGTIPPLDFHPFLPEIIFTQRGIKAADVTDPAAPKLRWVAKYHEYDGEPGISLSGKRLAARDSHDLYSIVAVADDESMKGDRLYTDGCSAAVSPEGARVMNNTFPDDVLGVGFHTHLVIRDWDGSNPVKISADICQPEAIWDNHHWSNHPDYIAVQGDTIKECYIVDVGDLGNPVGTRVTWTGGVIAPDLWVDKMVMVTGTLTVSGTTPAEVLSGTVVTLTNGSSVTVTTHTDHDGEYMILGTDVEIPDGTYDIVAQGLSPDPLGTVTVASGAGTADFDVTELDDDVAPDGLPDWWELRYFGDLTTTDGTGDQDDDGKTDLEEYEAGTSPVAKEVSPADGGSDGCVPCGPGGSATALLCLAVLAVLGRRSRA